MMKTISHFLHNYPLKEIIDKQFLIYQDEDTWRHEKSDAFCSGCVSPFYGAGSSIYGCIVCSFYLHKSCAELPMQIQHFFHSCPLFLQLLDDSSVSPFGYVCCNACYDETHYSCFRYVCESCKFYMHVGCALQSSKECEEGKEYIQHFSHWHPLLQLSSEDINELACHPLMQLSNEDINGLACDPLMQLGGENINELACHPLMQLSSGGPLIMLGGEDINELACCCCNICGKNIRSDSVYGCKECNFFLHNSCMMNLPRQVVNHSFHATCPLFLKTTKSYGCGGCGKQGSYISFRCNKCEFDLDPKCALLPTMESGEADLIQHSSHEHPLARREYKPGHDKECFICAQHCSGPAFSCGICNNMEVHKSCLAALPTKINHPFHPQHTLFLGPANGQFCRSCGNNLRISYRCSECWFYLDISCANLKPDFRSKSHPHLLTLLINNGTFIECIICKTVDKAPVLSCMPCKLNVHLHCHPSVPPTLKFKCRLHPLTLTEPPFEFEFRSVLEDELFYEAYCDHCEKERFIYDPVYYCAECKFIVEVKCVIPELLPYLTNSEDQSGKDLISTNSERCSEEDQALHIAKLNKEIEQLNEEEAFLKEEIQKEKAMIQELGNKVQAKEGELEHISKRKAGIETDCFMYIYDHKHNNNSTESSCNKFSENKHIN